MTEKQPTSIEMNIKSEKDLKRPPPTQNDSVQNAMGQFGIWHLIVFAVVVPLKFPVAFIQMSIIFLAPPVQFSCTNLTTIDKCSNDCVKEYDRSIFTETIITEWDLVCEKSQWANLSQMLVMFGILVGNVVFGVLSDKFGRRSPLVAAVIIQLIASVASAFVPWFWLFCVLRFITAFVTGGTMCISFVLIMEIIGEKYRELFAVLYQIPFNLGHALLPLFAYFIRDWRTFQFAVSIPSIILLSYYWLLPESPRWLFAVGRLDDSADLLRKAARRNNLPTETIQRDLEEYQKQKKNTGATTKKGQLFDLFRTPNLRNKTIFISFNWFVCGLTFFGLAQYIGQLGGDIFSNVAISAALEIPGTIICIFCMIKFGRKKTLIGANFLTGVVMVSIAFVDPSSSAIIVTLASIGLVGQSIAFPTVYLYGGELFPTVVRNIGIGIASMVARIGSMSSPFVAGLSTVVYYAPALIFGIIPLIGAVLVFFLPETRGYPLPETLKEGEAFGKKKSNDNSA